MVESLIIIPFFAIVFVCMIFMGRLYREKLRTINLAKECALTSASANCTGGCSNAQVSEDPGPDLDQGAEANPSQGAPGTAILTRGFKIASATVVGKTVKRDEIFGVDPLSNTPKTTTKIMCNETPENANWRGVFLFTYHKLTPW